MALVLHRRKQPDLEALSCPWVSFRFRGLEFQHESGTPAPLVHRTLMHESSSLLFLRDVGMHAYPVNAYPRERLTPRIRMRLVFIPYRNSWKY